MRAEIFLPLQEIVKGEKGVSLTPSWRPHNFPKRNFLSFCYWFA